MTTTLSADLLQATTEIVSAYVGRNVVNAGELPALIAKVHDALASLRDDAPIKLAVEAQAPVVPIKKSITPDYLICLEDGLKFRSMKRHLMTHFGLTPDQYRAKWGLPGDYPMVAPNYSTSRSAIAKQTGLGRNPRADASTKVKPSRK